MPRRMTQHPQNKQKAVVKISALSRVKRTWGRVYGPFDRASARLLDKVTENPRRRRIASISLAIAINVIVITMLAVFGRVQIPASVFPTGSISIILVEMQTPELPELRDPEITPELEAETEPELEDPEPEVIEELEPEPEPEPVPVTDAEPPAAPEPEPEPELILDLGEPEFAPPGDAPEPLIIDPAAGADDDSAQDQLEEEVVEQAPDEEAPEPLISVEPEQAQRPGLDELIGEEDADSDEASGEEAAADQEEELEETPPQNDDAFDMEPSFSGGRFSGRRFVRPLVQLPLGDTPIIAGSSGVVAIFCPEEFSDDDKAKECAGRRELRSGWRPGDSGEDWSRATKLLKRDRERGRSGPSAGPVADIVRRQRDLNRVEDLNDFRRNDPSVNNIADTLDDNISAGVEGDRPDIGPPEFEPGWARRDRNEPTEREIEELRKALEEAENNN